VAAELIHELGLAVAALTVWFCAVVWGRREGLAPWRLLGALWFLGVAAAIGGRLHFLLNMGARGFWSGDPTELLWFWRGLHAPGAIVGVALGLPIAFALFRLPAWRSLDVLVPSMLVGVGLARVGCFLNGCCFGKLCDAFHCVRFPRGSAAYNFQLARKVVSGSAEWSAAVHPFPLYLAAAALGSAGLGIWLHGRRSYEGRAAIVSATAFLVVAAMLEPFRENYYATELSWAGRLQFEWLAWGLAALAIALLAIVETWMRPACARLPEAPAAHRPKI
jgi:phosphatidylglycerol:prolipoprotein diacylglycerol transferase